MFVRSYALNSDLLDRMSCALYPHGTIEEDDLIRTDFCRFPMTEVLAQVVANCEESIKWSDPEHAGLSYVLDYFEDALPSCVPDSEALEQASCKLIDNDFVDLIGIDILPFSDNILDLNGNVARYLNMEEFAYRPNSGFDLKTEVVRLFNECAGLCQELDGSFDNVVSSIYFQITQSKVHSLLEAWIAGENLEDILLRFRRIRALLSVLKFRPHAFGRFMRISDFLKSNPSNQNTIGLVRSEHICSEEELDIWFESVSYVPQAGNLLLTYLKGQEKAARREAKIAKKVKTVHKEKVKRPKKPNYKKNHIEKYHPQGLGVEVNFSQKVENLVTRLIETVACIPDEIKVNHSVSLEKAFPDIFSKENLIVAFCLMVGCFTLNKTKIGFLATLGALAVPSIMQHTPAKKQLRKLVDFISGRGYEAQGFDMPQIVKLIASFFCAHFMYASNKKGYSASYVLSNMPKYDTGVQWTWSRLLDIVETILVKINEDWTFRKLGLINDNYPAITALLEDVDNLVDEIRGGLRMTCLTSNRIYSLEAKLRNELAKVPYGKEYQEVRDKLKLIRERLNPIVEHCQRTVLNGNGPRVEPLGIMLLGPPGVGKSMSVMPMLYEVVGAVIPPDERKSYANIENFNDHFWTYIPENDYCDKYIGQFVAHIDEIGALLDAKGAPSKAAMFSIRAINTLPYAPHMADIADKGTAMFVSKIVTSTTNRRKFGPEAFEGLYDVKAFNRRWRMAKLLLPKKEFRVDPDERDVWSVKLDRSKLNGDKFDTNVHEFYDYDLYEGKIISGPISFDEMVSECVDKFRQNSKGKEILDEALEGARNRLMKRWGYVAQAGGDDPEIPCVDENIISVLMELNGNSLSRDFVYSRCIEAEVFSFEDYTNPVKFNRLHESFELRRISRVKSLLSVASDKFVSVKDWAFEHPYLTTALAALPTIAAIGAIIFGETAKFESQDMGHSNERNYKVEAKRAKPNISKVKGYTVRGFRPQSGSLFDSSDRNFESQACSSIATRGFATKMFTSNCYKMYIGERGVTGRPDGTVWFLKGRVMVLPQHFVTLMEDSGLDGCVHLQKCGAPKIIHQYMVKDLNIFTLDRHEKDDIAFVRFPKTMVPHANLLKYFVDDLFDRAKVDMYVSLMLGSAQSLVLEPSLAHYEDIPITYTDGCSIMEVLDYEIKTEKGDCGSPLFLCDSRISKPVIAGMHIGGNKSRGCSAILMLSDMKAACDIAEKEFNEEGIDNQLHEHDEDYVPQCHGIGKTVSIRKDIPHHSARKTSILKSCFYGKWGDSICEPAKLWITEDAEGNSYNVLERAREKYSLGNPLISGSRLELIKDSVISTMHNNSQIDHDVHYPRGVVPYKQSVEGVPGIEFFDGIPRRTSAGYPLVLKLTKPGKTEIFGENGKYTMDTPLANEVERDTLNLLELAKQGIRSDNIYFDFPKDERRPIEKRGKTRMVSGAPLVYTIAVRMYFLSASRNIMLNRIRNNIAVGINPHSIEWTLLQRHMTSKGDSIIAGDFSNWDGSVSVGLLYQVLDVLNSYYPEASEEDKKVREILWLDVVNSKHIMGDEVYEMYGSVPSGHPLTAIINSIANAIITRERIVEILVKNSIDELRAITLANEGCVYIFYGDDNAIGVGPEVSQFVDGITLSKSFSYIGMTYTDELKTGVLVPFKSWSECEFLKRRTVWDAKLNKYICPLRLDTILEMGYWTRKGSPLGEEKLIVENSLYELSLHSKSIYEKYGRKMRAELSKVGFHPRFVQFEACRSFAMSNAQGFKCLNA